MASTPTSASASWPWPPASGTTPTSARPSNDRSSRTTTDLARYRTHSSRPVAVAHHAGLAVTACGFVVVLPSGVRRRLVGLPALRVAGLTRPVLFARCEGLCINEISVRPSSRSVAALLPGARRPPFGGHRPSDVGRVHTKRSGTGSGHHDSCHQILLSVALDGL